MSTLTEFLLERIAEDEAVALAATPGPWVIGHNGDTAVEREDYLHVAQVRRSAAPDATYIARHDPARVLATCKAHRAIVELHESWPVLVETEPTFETGDPTR